ncbi:MAG: hypothetical protein ACPGUV_04055 [Polyangiales bacterium]
MKDVGELWLYWRDPQKDARWRIGSLSRGREGYGFSYAPKEVLDRARQRGFFLLPEFPRPEQQYRAAYLFSTFSQRIPHPARPDRQRIFQDWGVVDEDDALHILGCSGGFQLTDRLELCDAWGAEDLRRGPRCFRIAGQAYMPHARHGTTADGAIQPDQPALLERVDSEDPQAVQVLTEDRQRVGFVPKVYNEAVASLLDAGVRMTAAFRRLLLCPDHPRWVVEVDASTKEGSCRAA